MKTTVTTLTFVSGLLAVQALAADTWHLNGQDNRIGFVATYDGIPFEGEFETFDTEIHFDPEDLDGSRFDIRIDTTSLESGSRDRDEGMRGSEWFAVEKFPTALFQTVGFERESGNRYRVLGNLTLKGVTKSVELPFSWQKTSPDEALLELEAHLDRREFNIGSGEWAEDDIIGFDVTVEARLELARG